MTVCSKCNVNKKDSEFNRDSRRANKLASVCKTCMNARRREVYASKKLVKCVASEKCMVSYDLKDPNQVEKIEKLLKDIKIQDQEKKDKLIDIEPVYIKREPAGMQQIGYWYRDVDGISIGQDDDEEDYEIVNAKDMVIVVHLKNSPKETKMISSSSPLFHNWTIPIRGIKGKVVGNKQIEIHELHISSANFLKK